MKDKVDKQSGDKAPAGRQQARDVIQKYNVCLTSCAQPAVLQAIIHGIVIHKLHVAPLTRKSMGVSPKFHGLSDCLQAAAEDGAF